MKNNIKHFPTKKFIVTPNETVEILNRINSTKEESLYLNFASAF